MFFNNCNWCRRPCCCRCGCEHNKNENKNYCDMNNKCNWNNQDKCCNVKFEKYCCDKKHEKDYCDKDYDKDYDKYHDRDHDKDYDKHDDKFDRREKKTFGYYPDRDFDDKNKQDDDRNKNYFNSPIYSFYPQNIFDRNTDEERFNGQNSYVEYSNNKHSSIDENEYRSTYNDNQPKSYIDERKQEVENNYNSYTPSWDDDKLCKHNTEKDKFCYNRHCQPVNYICFPIFK